jgi:pimeloyl-ACP methyl ester carboxylesterase
MKTQMEGMIDVDGGKVYYQAAGEGEALVLQHAGIADSGMWDSQWEAFAQRYRVIRFDIRGFGKSDPASGAFTRRGDLYRLLEQLGIERAHLVGVSLGGEVVIDFALEHPERVSSLVLVSAVPGGFELQGAPPPNLMEMFAAIQQQDWALANELQMRVSFDGPFRQPYQVDAGVRARAGEMHRGALAKGGLMAVEASALEPVAYTRLNEIDAPALVLAGALDHPEILRAAEEMAAAMPHAEKALIPNSAHLPNMEQPETFNQLVLGFLEKQS